MPFPFQFDRLINDFIFMTYLVGNDFLPSFPGFDISFLFIFIIFKYSLILFN